MFFVGYAKPLDESPLIVSTRVYGTYLVGKGCEEAGDWFCASVRGGWIISRKYGKQISVKYISYSHDGSNPPDV